MPETTMAGAIATSILANHAESGRPGDRTADPGAAASATPLRPVTVTIERQSRGCRELAFFSMLLIILDVGKLITSYASKYYNGNQYPIAQTLIVFLTEATKLAAIGAYLVYTGGHRSVSPSLKFAIPSTLYACTNNLYLYAFHYTTPAVWNVLTQSRIVITAIVYRTLFKKNIGIVQWAALALLTFAISFTQLSSAGGGSSSNDASSNGHGVSRMFAPPEAILLALLSSTLSVAAAVFMEYMFKNDERSFVDQQFQLSLYAALASLVLCWLEARSSEHPATAHTASAVGAFSGVGPATEYGRGIIVPLLLVLCIGLGAACGLVTGLVIKRLDNIVKIYSQALCGVVNALLCMGIFPDNFSPDWRYFVSLILVVLSIFMYERGNTITCISKA